MGTKKRVAKVDTSSPPIMVAAMAPNRGSVSRGIMPNMVDNTVSIMGMTLWLNALTKLRAVRPL